MHTSLPPDGYWPSGGPRPVATLDLAPPELSSRFGLAFHDGLDGLDRYQRASLVLPRGTRVWFHYYPSTPEAGTTIFAAVTRDFAPVRASVARALHLSEADFSWVAPEPEGGTALLDSAS